MKNHEQLPAIDENALDGVAGGFDRDVVMAIAKRDTEVVKATAKLPFNLAGAAANFAGDIYGAMSEYMHGIGDALTGGGDKSK